MAAHYPTIRGVGPYLGGAASLTHTIGGTSGISEPGDLILIFLESANEAFTAPVGGGYTQLSSSPQGIGAAAAANATRLTIFYKISNGTETTYVTGDSGDHNSVASLVIRGVDILNPINATAGTANAANATATCSSVTTTVPECLIVHAIANDRDLTAANTFGTITNANLTNLTEHVDGSTNAQDGGALGVFSGRKATAGSTGSTTIVQTNEEYAQITIAIAPLRRRISVT